MPAMSGTERRKPNCAPEAVASVVAPPGVMVETTTNRTSGRIASSVMAPGFSVRSGTLGPSLVPVKLMFAMGGISGHNAEHGAQP